MIEKKPKWIQIEWIRKMGNYTGQTEIVFLSLKLRCESPSYYNAECLAI